jgi:hypothetical protein
MTEAALLLIFLWIVINFCLLLKVFDIVENHILHCFSEPLWVRVDEIDYSVVSYFVGVASVVIICVEEEVCVELLVGSLTNLYI